MITDVRVLNKERMLREKDSVKLQNRQVRRELKCFLERKKESIPSENSAQKKNELVKKVSAPGFVRSKVGLLVSAVLAAELFASCGSVIERDTDADVQPNEVEMQEDAGPDEVRMQEDAETPDVEEGGPEVQDEGRVEDAQEIEEDGDSQESVEDAEEVQESDVDSSEDAGPDEALEDSNEAEADVPVCEPRTYTETRPPEPAGMICGNAREKIVTVQVTEYGEGCPRPGRETSLESVVYRIMRPIDLTNLVCARGNETEALNPGTYLIISLSPTEIQMGLKLASALNMTPDSPNLCWGAYQLDLTWVRGSSFAENNLLDASGTFIRSINVPGQSSGGFAAIDLSNGVFGWDLNSVISASEGVIRLNGGSPIVLTHLGTHDYESPGDEGRFEVRIGIDGLGSDDYYGFYRIRSK